MGFRRTDDFGPVVSVAFGGIHSERIAAALAPGRDAAILSPALSNGGDVPLDRSLAVELATRPLRGQPPRLDRLDLDRAVGALLDAAPWLAAEGVLDLEVNPLVVTPRGPVALDVLVRLGEPPAPPLPARPLDKVHRLLAPRSVAILGVSEKENPGRIILKNLLRRGYDPARIFVVKPGRDEIDGVRCVPDLASLPERVDLLVVAIDATQVPALLEEVIADRRAESLVVIPGGLGERSGSESTARRLEDLLSRSRSTDWGGPVVNGGNCLGIRCRDARVDTMFIPNRKLPPPGRPVPVALLSQSGAFAIAKGSRLAGLEPKFVVSIGNQMDLTVGDYLESLASDPDIDLFACYVEGFRPLDGLRWLRAARRITASGRTVLLYRAGRTPAGAAATASHTASISGDWAVTRELAREAGALVAETLEDFEDLIGLFARLGDRRPGEGRLGAMSNAGFECVAFADALGGLRLARFSDSTNERLAALFRKRRLDSIVEPHNPLDATPILDDEGWEEALRGVAEDDGVDLVAVGCVPLTGALNTLAASAEHGEDVTRAGSVADRTARVFEETRKPMVAVVDSGAMYDPMVRLLEERGVPVFRSADRAVRLLGLWAAARTAGR